MIVRARARPIVVPAAFTQRLRLNGAGVDGRDNVSLLVATRLRGPFKLAWVRRALADVIGRHEALRTTLRHAHGGPIQVIWQAPVTTVRETDLQTSPEDLTARLIEFADADMQLNDGPLVVIGLLTLGPSDHVVAIKMHHAIADGWSTAIVRAEFAEAYLAAAAGSRFPRRPLQRQFRDYSAVEDAPVASATEAFWRGQLAADLAPIPHAVGRLSPARRVQEGRPIPLGADTVADLAGVASATGTSRSIATLAAVASAFTQWREDFVRVSLVHANRYQAAFQPVVGTLADVLPLTIDLGGDPTYRDLVSRTRDTWRAALAHRVTLRQLSRIAGTSLAAPDSPLCDCEFNYRPRSPLDGTHAIAGQPAGPQRPQLEPVRLPATGRSTLVAAHHTPLTRWTALFVEDEPAALRGLLLAQSGSAATAVLDSLTAELARAIATAARYPHAPLRAILAG